MSSLVKGDLRIPPRLDVMVEKRIGSSFYTYGEVGLAPGLVLAEWEREWEVVVLVRVGRVDPSGGVGNVEVDMGCELAVTGDPDERCEGIEVEVPSGHPKELTLWLQAQSLTRIASLEPSLDLDTVSSGQHYFTGMTIHIPFEVRAGTTIFMPWDANSYPSRVSFWDNNFHVLGCQFISRSSFSKRQYPPV